MCVCLVCVCVCVCVCLVCVCVCVCLVCVCVCVVSIFYLPADEATAKSVKNSPKDSEKQTAVASKDKGNFF